MKRFFEKEVEKMFRGVSFVGFPLDGLVVFINSLSGVVGRRVLLVGKNEVFIRSLYRQSQFFKNGLFYYPEPPRGEVVPGFQATHNRIRTQALLGLSTIDGGACLVSEKALSLPIINKKREIKNLPVEVGVGLDRDVFLEKVRGFGFKPVEYVCSPNEISVRGDVVDVFPESQKFPLRLSFDFDNLESLSAFDVDTQRRTKSLSSFVFYDLVGEPIEKGRSLFDFAPWDLVVKINSHGGVFDLIVDGEIKQEPALFNVISPQSPNKQRFKSLIEKNTPGVSYIFYTDKKRKEKIINLGGFPVRGFIKSAFKTNAEKGLFIPDYRARPNLNKKTPPKYIQNNSLSSFAVGDLVVHVLHGVGEFRGLVIRGPARFEKEYIKILYAGGGVLFVPISKISLVHKYQGFGGFRKINNLGRGGWRASVSKTKKEIEAVSSSLVSLYSSRNQPRSFFYVASGEIDVAIKKSFPYKETKDQKRAIVDVLNDLLKQTPMDRLVCGDVGFGKTEVALRAIVRVAASTKQTVFLCPTTVLSDQHYITAQERLSPLGIRVALLSRFQSKKKQKEALLDVLSGSVDLIVGTHRLLSDDVVVPRLGLLVIDEEHRFGVKHKEKIRSLKTGLDVLSLSATPIPRTLQQSLLGVRDISRIETPPTTRKPINTIVEFFSWRRSVEVIEEELLRGGQVYFLHNKIQSIPYQVEKLRGFFPKEKIEYIHGQQDSKTLEKNLLGFFGGKISVLVCSTIIESGLDVSNANCIIVNNPQNLGLSQLYQIRGRVGRGSRQANCYLFVPKRTMLSEKAYRRLKTIERHTSLGSGYSIASNDLDIRGAGAVFGYKQSGQVSRVGLGYYNELLKRAVNIKMGTNAGVRPVDLVYFGRSLIPKHYVSNEGERLSFYTKINRAKNKKAVLATRGEIIDRFGKMPTETKSFFRLALVKLLYVDTLVQTLTINKDSMVFELGEKDINKNTVNDVLNYKNSLVLNKKFKEAPASLFVVFDVLEGFDWYSLAVDCNSLFCVQ